MTFQNGFGHIWPNLVLAKLGFGQTGLAKFGLGQIWSGQTWRTTLAKLGFGQTCSRPRRRPCLEQNGLAQNGPAGLVQFHQNWDETVGVTA